MALRGEQVSPKPAPRYCAPWQVYPSFNAARYAAYTRAARSPRPSSPVATVAPFHPDVFRRGNME